MSNDDPSPLRLRVGPPRALPPAAQRASLPYEAPRTLEETGLDPEWVGSLILRHLAMAGEVSTLRLAERVALPVPVVEEALTSPSLARRLSPGGRDVLGHLVLTLNGSGRAAAQASAESDPWTGPAPISFAAWQRWLAEQAERPRTFDAPALERRFGAAPWAQQSVLLIEGDSGSGRTRAARDFVACCAGAVLVPRYIQAGPVMLAGFQPDQHRLAEVPLPPGTTLDPRWVGVSRPLVRVRAAEASPPALEEAVEVGAVVDLPPLLLAAGGWYFLDNIERLGAGDPLGWLEDLLDACQLRIRLPAGNSVDLPLAARVLLASSPSGQQEVHHALRRRAHLLNAEAWRR